MNNRIVAVSLALACGVSPLHAQTVTSPALTTGAGPVSMGGFIGARIRIPLGGANKDEKTIRAGLTIAPMQHRAGSDLKTPAWRIGEGLEFGFAEDRAAPHLSLAGRSFGPAPTAPGGRIPAGPRTNLSDAGTAAAVAVGLAVLVGGGLLLVLDEAGDPDPCTPGECNNN